MATSSPGIIDWGSFTYFNLSTYHPFFSETFGKSSCTDSSSLISSLWYYGLRPFQFPLCFLVFEREERHVVIWPFWSRKLTISLPNIVTLEISFFFLFIYYFFNFIFFNFFIFKFYFIFKLYIIVLVLPNILFANAYYRTSQVAQW